MDASTLKGPEHITPIISKHSPRERFETSKEKQPKTSTEILTENQLQKTNPKPYISPYSYQIKIVSPS